MSVFVACFHLLQEDSKNLLMLIKHEVYLKVMKTIKKSVPKSALYFCIITKCLKSLNLVHIMICLEVQIQNMGLGFKLRLVGLDLQPESGLQSQDCKRSYKVLTKTANLTHLCQLPTSLSLNGSRKSRYSQNDGHWVQLTLSILNNPLLKQNINKSEYFLKCVTKALATGSLTSCVKY